MFLRGTKIKPLSVHPMPSPLELNLYELYIYILGKLSKALPQRKLQYCQLLKKKKRRKAFVDIDILFHEYIYIYLYIGKVPKWVVFLIIILLILILLVGIVLIILYHQNDLAEKEKYEEKDEEYNIAKDNSNQYQQLIANMQENMNHYEEIIAKNRNSRGINYLTFVLENSELRFKITELMSSYSQLTKENSNENFNTLNLINTNTKLNKENTDLTLNNTNLMNNNIQLTKENSKLINENQLLTRTGIAGRTICPIFCLYSNCQAQAEFEEEYIEKIPGGDVNETIIHFKKIKDSHLIIALDTSGNIYIYIYIYI